jgi:hypothetical protein
MTGRLCSCYRTVTRNAKEKEMIKITEIMFPVRKTREVPQKTLRTRRHGVFQHALGMCDELSCSRLIHQTRRSSGSVRLYPAHKHRQHGLYGEL